MSSDKDGRIDKVEIAFTSSRVDKRKVLDVICDSISSIIKANSFSDNVIFIKFVDSKSTHFEKLKKGAILSWQNKVKENELLFMQDIQATCNVKRA